jgi:CheY-like chemotaxis protein
MSTFEQIKESKLNNIQGLVRVVFLFLIIRAKRITELSLLKMSLQSSPKSLVTPEYRLLLVNDCPFLLKEFFFVEKIYHGIEAFNKIKLKPKSYYDAIILDIFMPIMDGVEASDKIHASHENHKLQAFLRVSSKTLPIFDN